MDLASLKKDKLPYNIQKAIAIRKPGTFFESRIITSWDFSIVHIPFHYRIAPGDSKKLYRKMKREDWLIAYRLYRLRGDTDVFGHTIMYSPKSLTKLPKPRKIRPEKVVHNDRLIIDLAWYRGQKRPSNTSVINMYPIGSLYKVRIEGRQDQFIITRNTGTQLFGRRISS